MNSNIDRKKILADRRKKFQKDKKEAKAIEKLGIVQCPMDLPSLERSALLGHKNVPFLSTGFDWIDKPHRVADAAINEIRALRAYILNSK